MRNFKMLSFQDFMIFFSMCTVENFAVCFIVFLVAFQLWRSRDQRDDRSISRWSVRPRESIVQQRIQSVLAQENGDVLNQGEIPANQITVGDLRTLAPGQRLNSEIIDWYIKLLIKRQISGSAMCILFMDTSFYRALTFIDENNTNGYNYEAVKGLTTPNFFNLRGNPGAKTIFDANKIIIPVHLNGNHWACACINVTKGKRIEFYDSMYQKPTALRVVQNLKRYVHDEYEDKKEHLPHADDEYKDRTLQEDGNQIEKDQRNNVAKKAFKMYEKDYATQENQVDCGVFMLQCCKDLCDDVYPKFKQHHVPLLREQMMIQIIDGYIP